MTEPRDRYHHGDLRRELIERATAAIRDSGQRGFSLRAIARASGVDVAAAYRHFRNKADLVDAVAVNAFSALARRMEAAQAGAEGAVARMYAIGGAYVAFAVDEPELFRLAFGPFGAGAQGRGIRGVGDCGLDPYEILLDGLTALHAEGRCAQPPSEAALPAWAAVHGLAGLLMDGAMPKEGYEGSARQVMETVLRGLCP